MTPYHKDDWLTVYQGDCREVMRQMEPESVHCVVTSPPYWGLRDYGTASWVGGDEGCDHTSVRRPGPDDKSFTNGGTSRDKPSNTCRKCGATRADSQLGLEATPEEFVANMVDVFREVKRVLRSDGTCWVNLGDSYASAWSMPGDRRNIVGQEGLASGKRADRPNRLVGGLKEKDLVGIPWRVAFALQADGWYLRSDIVWSKLNPMPESVTDRPTKSHEYVFLITKSARYYYDAEAVRESVQSGSQTSVRVDRQGPRDDPQEQRVGSGERQGQSLAGRNLRSVWHLATAPYPGAHFATFPPKLVEPCIKAGAPEKVCGECGAGWRRVTSVEYRNDTTISGRPAIGNGGGPRSADERRGGYSERTRRFAETTGFKPSCKHDAETVPATVLDPFAGSGTVGMVAQSLSRRAVLIDLNGDYLVQAMRRNQQSPLGLETA